MKVGSSFQMVFMLTLYGVLTELLWLSGFSRLLLEEVSFGSVTFIVKQLAIPVFEIDVLELNILENDQVLLNNVADVIVRNKSTVN